jgi:aspartate carbamoyltransferase catalytic subunit
MTRHLISVDSLDRGHLETLFRFTDHVRHYKTNFERHLDDKILCTYFNEPSTRTRCSFEVAMLRLGGKVISVENGKDNSSGAKGETLHDSLLTLSQMVDVIAIRHDVGNIFNQVDMDEIKVPVINAGDGHEGHPTQAILDLYTIWQKYDGMIPAGLHVLLVGDVAYSRTCRSLLQGLKKFEVKVTMAFPYPSMSQDVIHLFPSAVIIPDKDIPQHLHKTDVLYMTRFQAERQGNSRQSSQFILTPELIERMPADAIVLHPFPRNSELPRSIDKNQRARYIQQMENGPYIRQAILMDCLDPEYVGSLTTEMDDDPKKLPKDIWEGVEPLAYSDLHPVTTDIQDLRKTTQLCPGTPTKVSSPEKTGLKEGKRVVDPPQQYMCDMWEMPPLQQQDSIPDQYATLETNYKDESCGTYQGHPDQKMCKVCKQPYPANLAGCPNCDIVDIFGCPPQVVPMAYPLDGNMNRLSQLPDGCASLGTFYSCQFVDKEILEELDRIEDSDGTVIIRYQPLQHQPLVPGTMTGEVFLADKVADNFTLGVDHKIKVTPNGGSPWCETFAGSAVVVMTIEPKTGQIKARFHSGYSHKTKLRVSYEYEMYPEPTGIEGRWDGFSKDECGWIPLRPKTIEEGLKILQEAAIPKDMQPICPPADPHYPPEQKDQATTKDWAGLRKKWLARPDKKEPLPEDLDNEFLKELERAVEEEKRCSEF